MKGVQMREFQELSQDQLMRLLEHLIQNITVSIRMFCQARENCEISLERVAVLNNFAHWYSGALARKVSAQEAVAILSMSAKQIQSIVDEDLRQQLELCWQESVKDSQR